MISFLSLPEVYITYNNKTKIVLNIEKQEQWTLSQACQPLTHPQSSLCSTWQRARWKSRGCCKWEGEKRLENPVSKLADQLMVEDSEISNLENGLFYRAYLVEKFMLSSRSLYSSPWWSIFWGNGYCAALSGETHSGSFWCLIRWKIERQVWWLFRVKHSEKIMQHVEWLSTCRWARFVKFIIVGAIKLGEVV